MTACFSSFKLLGSFNHSSQQFSLFPPSLKRKISKRTDGLSEMHSNHVGKINKTTLLCPELYSLPRCVCCFLLLVLWGKERVLLSPHFTGVGSFEAAGGQAPGSF